MTKIERLQKQIKSLYDENARLRTWAGNERERCVGIVQDLKWDLDFALRQKMVRALKGL